MSESKPSPTPVLPEIPKMVTAVGGLLAAVAALLTALHSVGVLGAKPAPPTAISPTVAPSPTVALVVQAPTTAAEATRTLVVALPTSTATAATARRFSDDFGDPQSGWEAGTEPQADWGYKDGEYRVGVYAAHLAVWGNLLQGTPWSDFVLEVDARRVEGPDDNQYGVVVRRQSDANFYLFAVGSDGMFSVQRMKDDTWSDLQPFRESTAVRKGGAVNHLRVECRGPVMRFYVNNELMTEVQDATFVSGNVGLLASSYKEAGVVVHFDNLDIMSVAP